MFLLDFSLSPSHTYTYTHIHIHIPIPCESQKAWDSVLVVLLGQSWRKWNEQKFVLLFYLDSYLPPLVGPSHQAPWSLPRPPAYSFPTWCRVTKYLLGPRGMKITLSAMTSGPTAGVAEVPVPQAWAQWIWVSYFLTTSVLGWSDFLQLSHSTYSHVFISAG